MIFEEWERHIEKKTATGSFPTPTEGLHNLSWQNGVINGSFTEIMRHFQQFDINHYDHQLGLQSLILSGFWWKLKWLKVLEMQHCYILYKKEM